MPRGRRRVLGLIAVVLGVALAGCSREYESSYGPLKLEKTPLPVITGAIATPVRYEGMEFDLLDMQPFERSPEGVPRLALTIRSDNYERQWLRNPKVVLRCDETPENGDWFQGSTWESLGLVPTGEVRMGQLLLGFPRKEDAPTYNVSSCTNARVVVMMGGQDQTQLVHYAVDAGVINAAIREPRGRELPLPPSGP